MCPRRQSSPSPVKMSTVSVICVTSTASSSVPLTDDGSIWFTSVVVIETYGWTSWWDQSVWQLTRFALYFCHGVYPLTAVIIIHHHHHHHHHPSTVIPSKSAVEADVTSSPPPPPPLVTWLTGSKFMACHQRTLQPPFSWLYELWVGSVGSSHSCVCVCVCVCVRARVCLFVYQPVRTNGSYT